jgi:hypothetical protein
MMRNIIASTFALLGFSLAIGGCTRAMVVCELICACEHCNDQAKIEACNQLGTAEDVAAAYGCSDKWDAYTVCVEARGTCDEKESRFSTRDDAGDDRCQDEVDALDECINKASEHDGTSGNFN